jgi:hypothetical protein
MVNPGMVGSAHVYCDVSAGAKVVVVVIQVQIQVLR